jgi:heme/copper-type cytochrome/quinol oxidase subunit 4
MLKRKFFIFTFNLVCIAFLLLINSDLSIREAYARSIGFTLTNTYFPLIKFQYLEGQLTLKSPPTLDWTQTLILLLVFVDVYYLAKSLRGNKKDAPEYKNKS